MEPTYRYSESAVKPVEIEVNKNTVFLRKDIIEDKRTDIDGNEVIFYTYEEAKMSHEEFNEYSNLVAARNAINGTNDSENISNLLVGQENGDTNQLIIMEAIADLYDMIASLSKEATTND